MLFIKTRRAHNLRLLCSVHSSSLSLRIDKEVLIYLIILFISKGLQTSQSLPALESTVRATTDHSLNHIVHKCRNLTN